MKERGGQGRKMCKGQGSAGPIFRSGERTAVRTTSIEDDDGRSKGVVLDM